MLRSLGHHLLSGRSGEGYGLTRHGTMPGRVIRSAFFFLVLLPELVLASEPRPFLGLSCILDRASSAYGTGQELTVAGNNGDDRTELSVLLSSISRQSS
jgi:hypothetical protein